MAQLVLGALGSAVGGAIGGSVLGISAQTIGGFVGSVAGAYVDGLLMGGAHTSQEGPRLTDLNVLTSTEGTVIPRVYGRWRSAGQIIWATRFEEEARTRTVSSGGKGSRGSSQSVRTYTYYANLAVGLCEGEITRIGRVWADGKEIDLSNFTHRVYTGSEAQEPDSLIEAVEGEGNAPAYRGLAYIVFERLELTDFGNRVPQLNFEIFRSLSETEGTIEAVAIMPGAGEFVYDTIEQTHVLSEEFFVDPSQAFSANRHTREGGTDFQVSLDQLEAACPNVSTVALVVAWFGSDLRCGNCLIEPKAETGWAITIPFIHKWEVANLTREVAKKVSQHEGRPAYGGTPSDGSVRRAIAELKSRGLKVVLYPFILMDVPEGNSLTDPYTGGSGQPAYPWRGRITCTPAPGAAGTVDKTATAATQISAFFGNGNNDWRYRRFIRHYASLCASAGGVDGFLIGSEMVSLMSVRSDEDTFPAVAAMKSLAAEVRAILGSETEISYAADWSEWSNYRPADGSGDVYFHLDPLWADENIDYVGIDNYMPLADWRDGAAHLDAQAGAGTIYDLDYLQGNIAGGELFDWFYASAADRASQTRTPITDGAYGKPWVYRPKDIVSWWTSEHYDRPGGTEAETATAWVPQSKPIRFTETGCPAIDKGANQPNVFYDPKSSESFFPYFSNGDRDDFMQRRFIAAHLDYWGETGAHNPVSSVYAAPMVDPGDIFLWTWDARPYPVFPQLTSFWSDGANWHTGHWLNGRLGAVTLADLVAAHMSYHGFTEYDASGLSGTVEGQMIEKRSTLRDALNPLMFAYFVDACESAGVMRFSMRGRAPALELTPDDLAVADEEDAERFMLRRANRSGLPGEVTISYYDGAADYRQGAVNSKLAGADVEAVQSESVPLVLRQGQASRLADVTLREMWSRREQASFGLPPSRLALDPADTVLFAEGGREHALRLERITDQGALQCEAASFEPTLYDARSGSDREKQPNLPAVYPTPVFAFLDLPLMTGGEAPPAPHIAAHSTPWPGAVDLYRGASEETVTLNASLATQATIGETTAAFYSGPTGRFDEGNDIWVQLYTGELAAAETLAVLAGANLCAIENADGEWELVQFRDAELVADRKYRLSGLLRGQFGTEAAMRNPVASGARFVFMNDAVTQAALSFDELEVAFVWRYGPRPRALSDATWQTETRGFEGAGLRPLSPTAVKGRMSGGDLNLSWIRRTRTDGDGWAVEVPLGETVESYEVDIMDGGEAVRTLATASPAAVYTAAQIAADFGSPQSSYTVRVFQMSAETGRGTMREATIHV